MKTGAMSCAVKGSECLLVVEDVEMEPVKNCEENFCLNILILLLLSKPCKGSN